MRPFGANSGDCWLVVIHCMNLMVCWPVVSHAAWPWLCAVCCCIPLPQVR